MLLALEPLLLVRLGHVERGEMLHWMDPQLTSARNSCLAGAHHRAHTCARCHYDGSPRAPAPACAIPWKRPSRCSGPELRYGRTIHPLFKETQRERKAAGNIQHILSQHARYRWVKFPTLSETAVALLAALSRLLAASHVTKICHVQGYTLHTR